MNPEENNNDQAAPSGAIPDTTTDTTPDTPSTSNDAPSLDQVAADLTSAADANSLETPATNFAAGQTSDSGADSDALSSISSDASSDTSSDLTSDLGQSSDLGQTSADFSGDSFSGPKPDSVSPSGTNKDSDSAEDEPPLQPADPVPGSIGSAIAYSETAPNHSAPVGHSKNNKRAPFQLKDEANPDPSRESMPSIKAISVDTPDLTASTTAAAISATDPAPTPVAEPSPVAPAPATPTTPAPTPAPTTPTPTPAPTTPTPTPAPTTPTPEPTPSPTPEPTPAPTSLESQPTPEPVVPDSVIQSISRPTNTRKKFTKDMKLILIIGLAIILVAVIVIIVLFVTAGNNASKNRSPSSNSATTASTDETNTTSSSTSGASGSTSGSTASTTSLTCTKEGDSESFSGYGEVVLGKENVIAMYSNDELDSLGTTTSLNYASEEAASNGLTLARSAYNKILRNYNFSVDPFTSDYGVAGNTVTVTHQADSDEIDASSARVLGLYVIRGEVADDVNTLTDMYESNGYTCVEK